MNLKRHIRLILIGCGSGFLVTLLATITGLKADLFSRFYLMVANGMAGTVAAYTTANYCKRNQNL